MREKGNEAERRGEVGIWWNGGFNKDEGTLKPYLRHFTLTIDQLS